MSKKVFFIMIILICMFSCGRVYAYDVYEHENNDSYEKAQPVYDDYEVIGKVNEKEYYDYDYYRFIADDNGKMTVKFEHTYDDVDWKIEFYMYINGKYEEIQSDEIDSEDSEFYTLPFIGVVKGRKYFVRVNASTYSSGYKYKLKFDFVKSEYIEKEFNDSYSEATDAYVGTYEGIMNYDTDYDYYKFVASSNGKLMLEFMHTYDDCDWKINFEMYVDGKYQLIQAKEIKAVDGEKIEIPYVGVVKDRNYYICIWNKNYGRDNYKISINFESSDYIEKEFNDLFVTANSVVNNQKYYGIMNYDYSSYSYDVDYYVLNAVVDGALKMEFEHEGSSGDFFIDVYVYEDYTYKLIESIKVELNAKSKKERYYHNIKKGKDYYFKIYGSYECGFEKYSIKIFNKNVGKYADQVITAMDKEKSLEEIKFGKLKFNTDGVKNNEIGLKWKKVPGAKWYVIYGNECGKGKKYKYIKSVSKLKCKVKKIDGIIIKKAKNYKFSCLAIDEFGSVISAAKTVHVSTTGGKLGNIKEINLTNISNKKLTMKSGGTYKVKYKLNKPKKKIIVDHRGVRFESSNSKIAKVDAKKGKITAVKKGSCKIFVYTQNGCYRVISLKVE
ncbi:Ig-like domain-containing protein [Eubacterium sp.]|uniref:Ig-like domain-containing protein n=1 Tax=Eubacterium sp. TaxID=142586 RepID=UPI0025E91FB3|nr:Ig-like domain-containing protein [Eubacterium sp.]MCR5630077.1 Ig-like domain-containing protein [Eubacterium sp.]